MLSIRNLVSGYVTLLALLGLIFTGCGGGGDSGGQGGTGTLNVRITDSPYPFDLIAEAKVTIDKVEVHVSNSPTETSGFLTLPFEGPKTFDLLQLQGGVTATLVSADLPAGTYGQIRLLVSSGYVKLKDDREFNLNVPSGSQSGIKIFPNPPIVVSGGLTTDMILDFDVGKSFLPTPAAPIHSSDIKEFKFKPVIRVVNSTLVGTISGKVSKTDSTPLEDAALTAFDGTVEITSTSSQADGGYVLSGLPAGTYDITATRSGYASNTRNGVSVVVGNDTGGTDFILTQQ